MSGLTLVYDGITVSLTRFRDRTPPRLPIELNEFSRTAWGAINERGTAYESPHIWQVAAKVSDVRASPSTFSQADFLDALFNASRLNDADILVYDYARNYSEPAPRTRALAPGGTAVTVGGSVRYPAQFNARFNSALTLEMMTSNGSEWLATFQLLETTKILAT